MGYTKVRTEVPSRVLHKDSIGGTGGNLEWDLEISQIADQEYCELTSAVTDLVPSYRAGAVISQYTGWPSSGLISASTHPNEAGLTP